VDLSSPISSVIPSAHGAVLAVLARTHEPLSGRRVAALTDGRVGQRRVNDVLGELADAGIVRCERHPPAKLYVLNREHVAAAGIIALANQWEALLRRHPRRARRLAGAARLGVPVRLRGARARRAAR
jgi:hypothetical protein